METEPFKLSDGSISQDGRLARCQEFDERSRAFPVREEPSWRPRSYTWRVDVPFVIDQGALGSCVGMAITNELMARPAEARVGQVQHEVEQFAVTDIYHEAQKIDPWKGGSYPGATPYYEGTSILAGMKVAHKLGYFSEYRWSFSIEDLVYGLGHNGPAVLGLDWRYGMFWPDHKGFIFPVGNSFGGHAILARGVKIVWSSHKYLWWLRSWEDVDLDKSYVTLRNSWGNSWGKKGDCYISLRDLDSLLRNRGEAVFMVKRTVKV